jgi:hypothetical protein
MASILVSRHLKITEAGASSREHSDLGPKICGVNVFCHSPSFWSGVAQAKDSLVRAA